MMSGHRRALPVLLSLLLAAGLAGCSIPSWMPMIGKDKPKPPAAGPPRRGASPAPAADRRGAGSATRAGGGPQRFPTLRP